ncbi:PPE family protein [Mycobacterium haemophilum]
MPYQGPAQFNQDSREYGINSGNWDIWYGTQPPEVNSTNIYNGFGEKSLENAAWHWKKLSEDVFRTASSLGEWRTRLQGIWPGAAAGEVSEAVWWFMRWLDELSEQLKEDSVQIFNIAKAFTEARNMSVRPERVESNRELRAELAADNAFGLHDDKIAFLDLEYDRFWGNDATAMHIYTRRVEEALQALPRWKETFAQDEQLALDS